MSPHITDPNLSIWIRYQDTAHKCVCVCVCVSARVCVSLTWATFITQFLVFAFIIIIMFYYSLCVDFIVLLYFFFFVLLILFSDPDFQS